MITRRALTVTGSAGLLAAAVPRRARAAPPSPADPVAIVDTKKLDANKAVIAVTITGQGAPRARADDGTIRYNFTRDDGQWKIDDISGASDGEPWSIRAMLAASAGN